MWRAAWFPTLVSATACRRQPYRHGGTAGAAVHVDAAPGRLPDGGGDREAEAGTAGGPRAGGVAPGGPGGHPRPQGGRGSRAVVFDGGGGFAAAHRHAPP